LWAIPLAVVLLILGIAVAQQWRTLPGVPEFVVRYAGLTPLRARCTQASRCGCGCSIFSICSSRSSATAPAADTGTRLVLGSSRTLVVRIRLTKNMEDKLGEDCFTRA
jgi:hypothetical protein